MAENKIISYDVELLSTNKRREFYIPEIYTNDLYSTEFQFNVLDVPVSDLAGATATVLLNMRDGSFFNNTDVIRSGNVFKYILKENEGNHFGIAKIQLVVDVGGKEYATPIYNFAVMQGLDDKKANEVVINDLNSETRKAINDLKTQFQQVIDETTGKDVISAPEIIAARGNNSNLSQRLLSTDQQLTQTNKGISHIKTHSSIHSSRKLKPVMSIVEDDGHISILEKYYDSVMSKKYPISVATITARVDSNVSNVLNETQIKELSETGYFEFVSHSKTHISSENHTIESWEVEMKDSKEWLEERGYNSNVFVYPGGYAPADFRRITAKYFNTGINIDNGLSRVNKPPLNSMNLERVYIDNGVANAKAKIDEIVADGGWMILGTHSHYTTFQISDVEEVVDYARSKGVAVENIENALTYYGNLIEAGDPANYVNDGTVLDANGKWHGHQENFVKLTQRPLATDTFSAFPPYAISVYGYSSGWPSQTGMPTEKVGILITDRTGGYGTKITQRYIVHGDNRFFYREWDSVATTWSGWLTSSTIATLAPGSVDGNSVYSKFPDGTISYYSISSGNTTFPDSRGGILTTNRINLGAHFVFQTYEVAKTMITYKRFWDPTTGSWSAWGKFEIPN